MVREVAEIELIARGVLLADGHVLLCRHVAGNYRYLPGGHVEFGEPAHAALARELAEESDVRATVGPLVHADEHVFRQKGRLRHEINLVFHVEQPTTAPPGTHPVASREDGIAFDWVRIDTLDDADLRPAYAAEIIRRLAAGTPPHPLIWRSHVDA
jgi:ADP-ribose pyrophosphatase YjhB (NUDIX family)